MWSCCYKAGCHQIGGGWQGGGGGGDGVCVVEVPPVLQKSYAVVMSLLLVTLLLPPVALNHYNKVTIGFVIHKNLQKYVHDISKLMAAKWGRFNRQMWNSKMADKLKMVAAKLCLSTQFGQYIPPCKISFFLPKRVSDQFNKMEHEFTDFKELICSLLFSVASNHRNNVSIGFVIHENL